jgi:hypothetical protein
MPLVRPFFRGSQVYDPVALLRRENETLIIARVGMKASKRFMILTPLGEPACRTSHSAVCPMWVGRCVRISGTL